MNPLRSIRRLKRAPAFLARTAPGRMVQTGYRHLLALRFASVRKVHVGCGPQHRLEGWHNIEIQPFKAVDTVMDVTRSWPFQSLDYVYAENFLEHLELEDGVRFLENAGCRCVPAEPSDSQPPTSSG